MPQASKLAFLASNYGWASAVGRIVSEAAQSQEMTLIGPALEAPYDDAEYRRVLALMAEAGAQALIVAASIDTLQKRRLIVEVVEKNRLPSIYPFREFVEVGGLMADGRDLADPGRHAAHQVDLLLRGTKAGDIPFVQSTTIKMTINLRTTKNLGIDIPASLLARADDVIE